MSDIPLGPTFTPKESKLRDMSIELEVPQFAIEDNPQDAENLKREEDLYQAIEENPVLKEFSENHDNQLMLSQQLQKLNKFSSIAQGISNDYKAPSTVPLEQFAHREYAQSKYDQQPWFKKTVWNPLKQGTFTMLQGRMETWSVQKAEQLDATPLWRKLNPMWNLSPLWTGIRALTETPEEEEERIIRQTIGLHQAAMTFQEAKSEMLQNPRIADFMARANEGSFMEALLEGGAFVLAHPNDALAIGMEAVPTSAPSLALGFGFGKVAQLASKRAGTWMRQRMIHTAQLGGAAYGAYVTEATVAILELLEREGLDPARMSNEEWLTWASSEENQQKLWEVQVLRGGAIALTTAIGVAALQKLRVPQKLFGAQVPGGVQGALNTVMQAHVQVGEEMLGEAAAQWAAFDEVLYGDVILEGLGGGVFALAEAPVYWTRDRQRQAINEIKDYASRRRLGLEKHQELARNLPEVLDTLQKEWGGLEINEGNVDQARDLISKSLGEFQRVHIAGHALQTAPQEHLDTLRLTRGQVDSASRELAFLPVQVIDIIQNKEMIDVLRQYPDDIKSSLGELGGTGGKTVSEADLELRLLNKEIMSIMVSDIPSDSQLVQRHTMRGIRDFVRSQLIHEGHSRELAETESTLFARSVLVQAKAEVGGERSVASLWEERYFDFMNQLGLDPQPEPVTEPEPEPEPEIPETATVEEEFALENPTLRDLRPVPEMTLEHPDVPEIGDFVTDLFDTRATAPEVDYPEFSLESPTLSDLETPELVLEHPLETPQEPSLQELDLRVPSLEVFEQSLFEAARARQRQLKREQAKEELERFVKPPEYKPEPLEPEAFYDLKTKKQIRDHIEAYRLPVPPGFFKLRIDPQKAYLHENFNIPWETLYVGKREPKPVQDETIPIQDVPQGTVPELEGQPEGLEEPIAPQVPQMDVSEQPDIQELPERMSIPEIPEMSTREPEPLRTEDVPILQTRSQIQEYVRDNFISTPKGFSKWKVDDRKRWLHDNLNIPWGNLYNIEEAPKEVPRPVQEYTRVADLPPELGDLRPGIERDLNLTDEERGMPLMDYVKRITELKRYHEELSRDDRYPPATVRSLLRAFIEEGIEPRDVIVEPKKEILSSPPKGEVKLPKEPSLAEKQADALRAEITEEEERLPSDPLLTTPEQTYEDRIQEQLQELRESLRFSEPVESQPLEVSEDQREMPQGQEQPSVEGFLPGALEASESLLNNLNVENEFQDLLNERIFIEQVEPVSESALRLSTGPRVLTGKRQQAEYLKERGWEKPSGWTEMKVREINMWIKEKDNQEFLRNPRLRGELQRFQPILDQAMSEVGSFTNLPEEFIRRLKLFQIDKEILQGPPGEENQRLQGLRETGIDPRSIFDSLIGLRSQEQVLRRLVEEFQREVSGLQRLYALRTPSIHTEVRRQEQITKNLHSLKKTLERIFEMELDVLRPFRDSQADLLLRMSPGLPLYQRAKSLYQEERALEVFMKDSVATATGQAGSRPVRFQPLGSGYVYSGEDQGVYLRVTRPLVKEPSDTLEVQGETVRVSALFRPGKEGLVDALKAQLHVDGYDGLQVDFISQDGRSSRGFIPGLPLFEEYRQRGWLTRLLAVPMSEWIQKLPEEHQAIVPDLMRIPDFEVPKAYKNLQDLKRLLETMRKEKDYTGIKFGNPDEFLDYLIPRIERVLKNPGMRTLDEFIDILPEEHKEIRPSIEKLFGRTILLTNKVNSLEDFYKSLKGFSPKNKRNREDSYTLRNNIRKLLKGEHVEAPKPVSKPSPEPEPALITPKPISEVSIEPTKTLPPDYDINVWSELKQFLNYKRFLKTHVEIREFFAALGFKEPQGFDSWNIKQKHKYLRNLGYLNSKADIQKYIDLHKLTWKDIFSTFKRKGKPIPFEQIRRTLHTLIVQRLENKEDINNFLSLNQITVQGDFHERSLPRQKRFLRDIPLDVLKDERHLGAYAERNNVSMLEFATKERLASLNLEEPYLNPKVRPEGSVQAKGFRLPQGYEDLQHEVNSVLKTAELYEGRTPQEVVDTLRGILGETLEQADQGLFHYDPVFKRRYITILNSKNYSTFFHEMAHYLLQSYQEMSIRGRLNPDIKRSLEEAFGKPLHTLIRDDHETFAYGWEDFIFRGKTGELPPSIKKAFHEATEFLRLEYESREQIYEKRANMSEPVVALLDRIVLGSKVAEEVLSQPRNIPLGTSAGDLGERPEEYAIRRQEGRNAGEEFKSQVIRALVRDLPAVHWGRREDISEEAVEQEMFEMLDERLWNAVLNLYDPDSIKINSDDIKPYHRIPISFVKDGGMDIDWIADSYGYDSGRELLEDLRSVARSNPTKQGLTWEISMMEEARNRVRQKMDILEGRVISSEEAKRIALNVSGTVDRSGVLSSEINALGEFPDVMDIFEKAKEEALDFQGTEVEVQEKIVNLGMAQAQAARRAALALQEGNMEDARHWKMEELRLNQSAKAYGETQAEIEQSKVEMSQWENGVPEGHSPEYRRIILTLMRLHGIMGDKEVEHSEIMNARRFLEDRQENLSILVPDYMFEHDTDPTLKKLLELGRAIRSLSNASREDNKQLSVEEDPNVLEGSKSIKKGLKIKGDLGWVSNAASGIYAELRKRSHIFRDLDQGQELGWAMRNLYMPISEAIGREGELKNIISERDRPLRKWQRQNGKFLRKRFTVDESTYRGREIITMAELYLSEAGRKALTEGARGLSDGHIQQVLQILDENHWKFIQDRQALMESIAEEISRFQTLQFGITPEPILKRSIEIGGKLRTGGYSLFGFDEKIGRSYAEQTRERSSDMIKGRFIEQFDRLGSLRAFEENKDQPVSLDESDIYRGMSDAIHDLTIREATKQVGRLLKAKPIRNAIRDRGGKELVDNLDSWIRIVRAGYLKSEKFYGLLAKEVRTRYTISVLGLSLRTILAQPLGLAVSTSRIGMGHMLRAMLSPLASLNLARDKSQYMRHVRRGTILREQAERTQGKTPERNRLDWAWNKQADFSLYFMQELDMMVSGWTWTAQYNKAISEGKSERDAIFLSDLAVKETQGAGGYEELTQFSGGAEWQRILSLFQTFFISLSNLVMDAFVQSGRYAKQGKLLKAVGHAVGQLWWLVVLPRIGAMVILGENWDSEEDEELWSWFLVGLGSDMTAGVPLLRDIMSSWHSGFPIQGPAPFQIANRARTSILKASELEFDETFWKNAYRSVGPTFNIPTSAPIRVYEALYDRDISRQEPWARWLSAGGLRQGELWEDLERDFDF